MSNINPKNIPGANAVIVGRVGGVEFPAYDKEGDRGFKQVRVAVNEGYKDKSTNEWVDKGTTWYTYTARTEDIEGLSLNKGDVVRIDDAKLETREFTRKSDGSTGQEFGLRYGDLSLVQRKGDSGGGQGGNGFDSDRPF